MKTTLYVLIILLSISITNQATADNKPLSGQAKIDSLEAELPKAKGDTNEVKLLAKISFAYYRINPEKGLEYGLEGVELAKEINWKKGKATCYNGLGVNYTVQSDYSKALEVYKKSLEINKEIGDKEEVGKNLLNIGIFYQQQSDYPKALDYFNRSLKISEKLGDKKGVAGTLGNMAIAYYSQSNYPKALEYYIKSLKINEEIGNKQGVASNLSNIGSYYRMQSNYPMALEYFNRSLKMSEELEDKKGAAGTIGSMAIVYHSQSDYPKALEYYNKSLKINEELGNNQGVAYALGNIGLLYDSQSDYPKALEYFNRSLKINEELGNKYGVANNLGNIGSIYRIQKNYSKALEYHYKSLKISEEIGNNNIFVSNLFNIGNIYFSQSDYPKALEYYNKSLKINEELGNKHGIAQILGNMGELYLNLSQESVQVKPNELNHYVSLNKGINLNKSIESFLQAIKIFEEIGELNHRSKVLKNLADAYKQRKDMTKAYEALEEHHKLKDSVFNQENSDKIAALEKAREEDLNRKEIEKQKALNAEKERINKIIMYVIIAAFIALIIVLITIYRLLKRSDKLLYNVLPVSIAKRLKKKEHPISDYFTQASIVFIDIVDFTEHSKDADPRRVVEALNKIFTKYDAIANKYGLEKIKTIGDSYMAAAGIPEVQKDNTHRAAQMALEVKAMMQDYHTADGTKIEVRIGLDCGPVVAGVIGENKFIYDMWSDAVNTASRMESSSIAGEVHVSERFKNAVTEYEEFDYVERGEMDIKGKGKMKTFFIGNKEKEVV